MKKELGVKCAICGHKEIKSLIGHLKSEHRMTSPEYKMLYPGNRVMTGHSRRTLDYWVLQGCTLEEAEVKVKEWQAQNMRRFQKRTIQEQVDKGLTEEEAKDFLVSLTKLGSIRCKEYYLVRGFSEEEATEKVREVQANYSAKSSKFLGHNHSNEAKEKISEAVKRQIVKEGAGTRVGRLYSAMEGHRSKAERGCFGILKELFPELQANVEIGGKIVDMLLGDLIIEFYGDFWHKNPDLFSEDHEWKGIKSLQVWEKDKKRLGFLEKQGYRVFVLWEKDWKKKQDEVIKKIKELYEHSSKNVQ